MKAFTDYPLLDDEWGRDTRDREVELLEVMGAFCTVKWGGKAYQLRTDYVYAKPSLKGRVPVSAKALAGTRRDKCES